MKILMKGVVLPQFRLRELSSLLYKHHITDSDSDFMDLESDNSDDDDDGHRLHLMTESSCHIKTHMLRMRFMMWLI
ncbi:hypothetical protein CEXT_162511 [Caerostris extrusa]|uniref:Uncharacterized protein n=1 Tax=Caerostris extrusa TaxID=172846 RepID=A0AAV4MAD7_CAEEX|nr:hypothetical protein CEXT_162511 [Caerostris extrusa]